MVDYKLLADNDPGGDLDTAFATMSAETVTSNPVKRMNYIDVSDECGYALAVKLATAIAAAIGGGLMPDFVETVMNGRGLDVNNAQVQAQLQALADNPAVEFDAADMALLTSKGAVSSPKYPGLKVGHLDDARRKRTAGEI